MNNRAKLLDTHGTILSQEVRAALQQLRKEIENSDISLQITADILNAVYDTMSEEEQTPLVFRILREEFSSALESSPSNPLVTEIIEGQIEQIDKMLQDGDSQEE